MLGANLAESVFRRPDILSLENYKFRVNSLGGNPPGSPQTFASAAHNHRQFSDHLHHGGNVKDFNRGCIRLRIDPALSPGETGNATATVRSIQLKFTFFKANVLLGSRANFPPLPPLLRRDAARLSSVAEAVLARGYRGSEGSGVGHVSFRLPY